MENHSNLSERLSELFLSGEWIVNTNFRKMLEDVTREEAVQSIDGLNSIYRLAYHVNYYLSGLCKVFEHNILDMSDRFSFPEDQADTPEQWETFKIDFQLNARRMISLVEKMSGSELDSPFVDPHYGSNRVNLEAMIDHSYYHLGQISLIKKLVRKP